MNREIFRKAELWAVVIPIVCVLWAFGAMVGVFDSSAKATETQNKVENAERYSRLIMRTRRGGSFGSEGMEFGGISSVRECARYASIQENRIAQGGRSKGKPQKGGLLINETYSLEGIHLEQIAKFIDYAEMNYASLNCVKLTMNHDLGKGLDRWNTTVTLRYLVRDKEATN